MIEIKSQNAVLYGNNQPMKKICDLLSCNRLMFRKALSSKTKEEQIQDDTRDKMRDKSIHSGNLFIDDWHH